MLKTPFRQPSSCWRGRPAPSTIARSWGVGSTRWPTEPRSERGNVAPDPPRGWRFRRWQNLTRDLRTRRVATSFGCSFRGGRWLAREVPLTGAAHLHGRQEQRAGRRAAWMSGRHSQGAAVAGPRPAASTAEPARLGPGRGPISMGMIRPAGTPGEWSAEIESVFFDPGYI